VETVEDEHTVTEEVRKEQIEVHDKGTQRGTDKH